MTADAQASAGATLPNSQWHTINWSKAIREVRRLQVRIVKAVQEGRWNKARVLQRLLTHSFSAKVLAVRQVIENRGRKTPGVDGKTWSTPTEKMQAVESLRDGGYYIIRKPPALPGRLPEFDISGNILPDHVHMMISIPPKYAASQVVGYIKGKSAIHTARAFLGRRRDFRGQSLWARGYFVSTVGTDEATIREYIRRQQEEDKRLDQLQLY